jgi:leukotriene-A4 hydrolase
MSAIQTKLDLDTNTFYFEQTIAISSYLIAIAVGYLVSYDLSACIRVWTEPSLLDRCKYEFAETNQVLFTAENLLGEYKWKRNDFIILPPSLPCKLFEILTNSIYLY